jgi:hypothetical protein
LLNYCLYKGVAAVYKILGVNKKKLVWTDDTPFHSHVRRMVVTDGKLALGVNEERSMEASKADADVSRVRSRIHENIGGKRTDPLRKHRLFG